MRGNVDQRLTGGRGQGTPFITAFNLRRKLQKINQGDHPAAPLYPRRPGPESQAAIISDYPWKSIISTAGTAPGLSWNDPPD